MKKEHHKQAIWLQTLKSVELSRKSQAGDKDRYGEDIRQVITKLETSRSRWDTRPLDKDIQTG